MRMERRSRLQSSSELSCCQRVLIADSHTRPCLLSPGAERYIAAVVYHDGYNASDF